MGFNDIWFAGVSELDVKRTSIVKPTFLKTKSGDTLSAGNCPITWFCGFTEVRLQVIQARVTERTAPTMW